MGWVGYGRGEGGVGRRVRVGVEVCLSVSGEADREMHGGGWRLGCARHVAGYWFSKTLRVIW